MCFEEIGNNVRRSFCQFFPEYKSSDFTTGITDIEMKEKDFINFIEVLIDNENNLLLYFWCITMLTKFSYNDGVRLTGGIRINVKDCYGNNIKFDMLKFLVNKGVILNPIKLNNFIVSNAELDTILLLESLENFDDFISLNKESLENSKRENVKNWISSY